MNGHTTGTMTLERPFAGFMPEASADPTLAESVAPVDVRAAFRAGVLAMSHGDTIQCVLAQIDPEAAAERQAYIRQAAMLEAQRHAAAMVPDLVAQLIRRQL